MALFLIKLSEIFRQIHTQAGLSHIPLNEDPYAAFCTHHDFYGCHLLKNVTHVEAHSNHIVRTSGVPKNTSGCCGHPRWLLTDGQPPQAGWVILLTCFPIRWGHFQFIYYAKANFSWFSCLFPLAFTALSGNIAVLWEYSVYLSQFTQWSNGQMLNFLCFLPFLIWSFLSIFCSLREPHHKWYTPPVY